MGFFNRPDRPFWRVGRQLWLVGLLVLGAAVAGTLSLDRLLREQPAPPPAAPVLSPFYAQLMRKRAPAHSEGWDSRKLEVGSAAPDFTLPRLEGGEVALGSFRGQRPVVLVFGSFSCNLFCGRLAELERIYQKHKGRAEFLFVNISEAGHAVEGLEFVLEGTTPGSPLPLAVRRERAAEAMRRKGLTMPCLIDTEEAAETAYDAFPQRLVVIDREGKIALDLGRGLAEPWDFSALEQYLTAE